MLFGTMTTGFIICTLFGYSFFNLLPINKTILLIIVLLSAISFVFYEIINYIITLIFHKYDNTIELESFIFSKK